MDVMEKEHSSTPEVPGQGHRPVLLHPLIEHLQPSPGQTVVDATFGGGGVTAALLEAVGPSGRVIAFDRDPEAIGRARALFSGVSNLTLVNANFRNIEPELGQRGTGPISAIAFDLGLSSLQLADPARGFSFSLDGPLDMRMDPYGKITASTIINEWSQPDLAALFWRYGGERWAARIAAAVVAARPLSTTRELAVIVEGSIPRAKWPPRIHPATRTFQALRIEVNDELGSLRQGLQGAINLLMPGGRLGVISFHSLEDNLVKNLFHVAALDCICPPHQPFCTCAHRALLFQEFRKAIRPDMSELERNPRARSARLRVAQRI